MLSKKNKFSFWWLSLFIILLDQISKIVVRNTLTPADIIKITPKFFWLTYVQNTGAAFSFSFGNVILNRVVFIIVTILAIVFVSYLKIISSSKLEHLSFALILGGAIGNLIDRIFIGSVTDFIWWDFPDVIMPRWPVFNLADSSIVIAVVLLLISAIADKKISEEDR